MATGMAAAGGSQEEEEGETGAGMSRSSGGLDGASAGSRSFFDAAGEEEGGLARPSRDARRAIGDSGARDVGIGEADEDE